MKKKFTDEEVHMLRDNPNTYCVSNSTLQFKKEFKQLIYDELSAGKRIREILYEHGYNPEILGDRRLHGIVFSVRKQHDSEAGIHEGTVHSSHRTFSADTPEAELKELRGRVEFLEQEIEFLKKITSAKTLKK